MRKILITGMSPVLAGTETFIMTYYRNLDKTKFHVDFIVRTDDKIIFEDEILSKGSKIYRMPRKNKNIINYYKVMNDFFKSKAKEYDIIWYNGMGIPNIDFLIYAKKYGIPRRIIHSHSSMWKGNIVKKILHNINKRRLEKFATDYFACSSVAADYMFSGNIRDKAVIINNAIEVDQFTFDKELRNNLRSDLGWEDNKIIGTVGRMDVQKNQPFLIDVFHVAIQKDPSLRLIIVGKTAGENSTEPLIKEKIKQYGLEEKVLLAGSQFDMKKWLSAFDIFILPSLFEGLPLSAVEAQSNGLPVIVSDAITDELNINENVQFISFEQPKDEWADLIIATAQQRRLSPETVYECFNDKGFNIKKQVHQVESILL